MLDPILIVSCGRSVLGVCTRKLPPGPLPSVDQVVGAGLPMWSRAELLLTIPAQYLRVDGAKPPGDRELLLENPRGFALPPVSQFSQPPPPTPPGASPDPIKVVEIPAATASELTVNVSGPSDVEITAAPALPIDVADQIQIFVLGSDGITYAHSYPIAYKDGPTFTTTLGVAMLPGTPIVALIPGYLPFVGRRP